VRTIGRNTTVQVKISSVTGVAVDSILIDAIFGQHAKKRKKPFMPYCATFVPGKAVANRLVIKEKLIDDWSFNRDTSECISMAQTTVAQLFKEVPDFRACVL